MTGRPSIASKMPSKSPCWIGSSSVERRPPLSARRRPGSSRCTTGSRSSPKNMCSVRQRPMPSAPKLARLGGVGRRVGVGAHARAGAPRRPSRVIVAEVLAQLRRRPAAPRPSITSPRAAVDRDPVALATRSCRRRVNVRASASICDRLRSRPRTACPCRARRPPRGRSCRRARSARPAPATHAVDVLGRRLHAHQDDRLARRCRAPPPCRRRTRRLPTAAPGEAVRPRREHVALARSGRCVGCSSWSSCVRIDPQQRLVARSISALVHHVDARPAPPPRPVRLPVRVCSM